MSLQLGTWGAEHGGGYEEDADRDVNSTIFCVPNTRLSICHVSAFNPRVYRVE